MDEMDGSKSKNTKAPPKKLARISSKFYEADELDNRYDSSFTPVSASRTLTNLPPIFRCGTGDSSDGSTSFESRTISREASSDKSSGVRSLLQAVQQELLLQEALGETDSAHHLAELERLLLDYGSSGINIDPLRDLILAKGLPRLATDSETKTLRARVWKALLGVKVSSAEEEEYTVKANDETAAFDSKIKDDAFRTFKGDKQFWQAVNEDKIVRVLRAVSFDVGYVQGMNVLLGPFLMTMGELDSYACFRELVVRRIPSYVTKDLEGVHRAIALASRCLSILDPQLHNHIQSKLHTMTVFSLKYLLTLMANTQPLEEVMKIWDAVFAYGTHLSIFVFLAFLIAMRNELLAEKTGNKIMRLIEGGVLKSELMVKLALELIKQLPVDLLEEARSHGAK